MAAGTNHEGYISFSSANKLVFSEYQNPNNWYIRDNNMARNNRSANYSIQEVENGYIVVKNDNGYGKQFVFNTIEEVNDFIAARNQEELV